MTTSGHGMGGHHTTTRIGWTHRRVGVITGRCPRRTDSGPSHAARTDGTTQGRAKHGSIAGVSSGSGRRRQGRTPAARHGRVVPGRPNPAGHHAHRRAREHATATGGHRPAVLGRRCSVLLRVLQRRPASRSRSTPTPGSSPGPSGLSPRAGRSRAEAGKRKKGAWIGSATAVALIVVAVATAEPEFRRR